MERTSEIRILINELLKRIEKEANNAINCSNKSYNDTYVLRVINYSEQIETYNAELKELDTNQLKRE